MSQTQPISTEIDGKTYTMYMLPPLRSHDLLMDVVKMIGPSLGPVFDVLFASNKKSGGEVLEQEIGPDFFSKAARTLFDSLSKGITKEIIFAFAEITQVDNVTLKPIFDSHFMGRLDVMYRWLAWGMGVQWGKPLSALVSGVSGQGARIIGQVFPSPKASNG